MRFILALIILSYLFRTSPANAQSPKKYALLVAVTKYEHAGMNKPQLEYPEVDAKELGELLQSFGYEVDFLLGKYATQDSVRKKLDKLNLKGEADGVVLIGLFGHGVLIDGGSGQDPEGCFCPYDVPVRFVKDSKGTILNDDKGEPMTEPDPSKLIKVAEILLSLKVAKAGNRVVLADCCRKIPNQARGRSLSVGASFKITDIPENTAVLFGCSPNQQAFEHKDWGHGAFTRCLLDELRDLTRNGEDVSSGVLADRLKKKVPKLVASKNPSERQIPKPFSNDSIDLQLNSVIVSFEGSKAGERRELVPKIFFRWCPAGTFVMGNNEVKVELTRGFWLGETEVTQSQWRKVMGTMPWGGNGDVKEGSDYPATYVSYDDALLFVEKLTSTELNAGELPRKWKYTLPTGAQWEYACRAGTKTKYSFGNSESQIVEYAWFDKNTSQIDEGYGHQVGLKKANPWGFRDMHGNVDEWCSDRFGFELKAGRDPVGQGVTSGPARSYRVIRGGCYFNSADKCDSAHRIGGPPDWRTDTVGFRFAAVPE